MDNGPPAPQPRKDRTLDHQQPDTDSQPDSPATPPSLLVGLLYDELRSLAHRQLSREPAGGLLQTTALVHEAFLRLGGEQSGRWPSRHDYFLAAAVAMRRILVEQARARKRLKRGGDRVRVELHEETTPADNTTHDEPVDWLALDAALTALESRDAELARVVSLRYFAGLSVEETARALEVSTRTIDRQWRVARAFLKRHLIDAGGEHGTQSDNQPR